MQNFIVYYIEIFWLNEFRRCGCFRRDSQPGIIQRLASRMQQIFKLIYFTNSMTTFDTAMLLFIFFLIFLFFLERLRNANKWKFCRFIPRTRLLRIAIIAQILAYIVKYVGLNPEINSWISLLARIGFYSAFSSWILDIIWWATKKFSSRKMSPPQILKDMSLIAISTLIFAIQLNDKGALTAIGSAAVMVP